MAKLLNLLRRDADSLITEALQDEVAHRRNLFVAHLLTKGWHRRVSHYCDWYGIGDRSPAGALLIPLVLGAALQLSGLLQIALPAWSTALAMAAIGAYVGLRFDRATVRYVLKRLPTMICCSLLLIAVSPALAYVIALLLQKDFLSVYLATSPGGLDSMAIIAVDSKADISLVLAMQALRLFTVILIGPVLVKWVIVRICRPV